MTKKSLILSLGIAAAAGAAAALRRKTSDVRYQADREIAHCDRLLQQLGQRTMNCR